MVLSFWIELARIKNNLVFNYKKSVEKLPTSAAGSL
jgi:hypothetical protein